MYDPVTTSASLNALGQLSVALQEHHEDVVLVGGWAPYFILQGQSVDHGGSRDIDLALNKEALGEGQCSIIRRKIDDVGYHAGSARFFKDMPASSLYGGVLKPVHVDILCHREGGTGELTRITTDINGSGFHGMNIAFDFNCEQSIEFELNGTSRQTTFRVVDLVGSLVLKSNSFESRAGENEHVEGKKDKDAFDMFAVTHYNGGARHAAKYVNQALDSKEMSEKNRELIGQSLSKIKRLFRDENQDGTIHANNYEPTKYSKETIVGQMKLFLDSIALEIPD
jgi:hypothetical protein